MEDQRKNHLDYVASTVARLASNSFQLKGWSVTLASALIALGAATDREAVLAISTLPAISFWLLDSYYVHQERRFRAVWNHIRSASPATLKAEPYSMSLENYPKSTTWARAFASASVWPFHVAILAAIAVTAYATT